MKLTIVFTFWAISYGMCQGSGIVNVIKTDNLSMFTTNIDIKDIDANIINAVIRNQSAKIFNYLLESDVNFDVADSTGTPVLLAAVQSKNPLIVADLLNLGVDANAQATSGLHATPLMWASAIPDLTMMRDLLRYGAQVNAVDVNSDHALNWATYYGHVPAMKLLIEHGTDIELSSKHGKAVDVAYRLWHADSVAAIFRSKEKSKNSLLVAAVRAGDVEEVRKRLNNDLGSDIKDQLGIPLLHHAAEVGNLELVHLLIEYGADVNALNRVGQTALAYAARFKRYEVVGALLKNGADPNHAGQHYRLTPLIGAAVGGDISIAQQLLAAGADIDVQDSINQAAALHWAMMYQNTALATALIAAGADINMRVFDGVYTGASLARAYGYPDVVVAVTNRERALNPLYGSWSFDTISYHMSDTTITRTMEYPGRLIVSDNRYSIMYNPYATKRKGAHDLSALTEEEMIYAFKTLAFNSGSYEISNKVLTTTANMAKVAGFEGGIQQYRIETRDDGSVTLTMFDETYPDGSKPEWFGKLSITITATKE